MCLMSRCILGLAVIAFAVAPVSSYAQEFPARPVRIIVPNTPGTAPDLMARTVATAMTGSLGQSVLVDYKPGAGGLIGFEYVAKQAASDGYTLLLSPLPYQATFPVFVKDLRFDPIKDLPPFLLLAESQLMLASPSPTPWSSFNEMVSYAKGNPGKLNWGSPGALTNINLLQEALMKKLGLNIVQVSYKGGSEFMAALISNEIQLGIVGPIIMKSAGGKAKLLAITGQSRSSEYPQSPTFAELGHPEFTGIAYALNVPAGTPQVAINRLHSAGSSALQHADVKGFFSKGGFDILGGTQEAAAKKLAQEAQYYSNIARELKIQPR